MLNKNLLLENLHELASREVQVRLWLKGNEKEMSTYTEAICGVFDDAGLGEAIDTGFLQKSFSPAVLQSCIFLRSAVKEIGEDLHPLEVIEHSRMPVVRRIACELLELFEKEL